MPHLRGILSSFIEFLMKGQVVINFKIFTQHGLLVLQDLVFALILANNQLVTLVRMKKYFLHPMDLHLIINLVNSSESFKAAESWIPICLPKFDSR